MKALFYISAIVSTTLVSVVAVFNQEWCDVLKYVTGLVIIAVAIKILKHRDDFLHDTKLILNGDSPHGCKWAGSLVILAALALCIAIAIIALICSAVYWLITLL